MGCLIRSQFLEWGCWERGSAIFFLGYITKNLNWDISIKNLVTFKRFDEVKDEKF